YCTGGLEARTACQVAARARQASHQPAAGRISGRCNYYRNCRGRVLADEARLSSRRNNDIDIVTHKLLCMAAYDCRISGVPVRRLIVVVDAMGPAANGPPALAKLTFKGADIIIRVSPFGCDEEADLLRGLLRLALQFRRSLRLPRL